MVFAGYGFRRADGPSLTPVNSVGKRETKCGEWCPTSSDHGGSRGCPVADRLEDEERKQDDETGGPCRGDHRPDPVPVSQQPLLGQGWWFTGRASAVGELGGDELTRHPVEDALVGDACGWYDDDLATTPSGSQTEVDVLAEVGAGRGGRVRDGARRRTREGRQKAAQGGEDVSGDEQRRSVGGRDLPNLVMLPLVEVVKLDQRHRKSRTIDGVAERQEPLVVVPRDQLRRGNGGVVLGRGGGEEADCVRGQRDIVVAEQVVHRALHHLHDDVGGRAVADTVFEPPDIRTRRHRGNTVEDGFRGSVVDDEKGECRVVLGDQRCEGVIERRAGVTGDDHRDDGGHVGS